MIQKKYILWDFDETLGYREGKWTHTVLALLNKDDVSHITYDSLSPMLMRGYPWRLASMAHSEYMGNRSWWEYMDDFIRQVLVELGLDKNTAHNISQKVRDEYLEISNWKIYNDTRDALEKSIDLGFKNIILSNHVPELDRIVNGLGLDNLFDHIFTSGNIGYEKPRREIFDHALAELHTGPGECVMVGDNIEADVTGAKNSGIDAILVRKTNENSHKFYSTDLAGIFDIIEQLSHPDKPAP